MTNSTNTINQLSVQLAKIGVEIVNISGDISDLKVSLSDVKKKLEGDYATKEWVDSKYSPTKTTVTWILTTFGAAIIGALALFITRGGLK
jgi:hypothetical protein